mmetsp:Transcript_59135/g.183424  ORF Transcript_59135/g.183424 Transcript_59135/m.183424 type:complete len:502 (+) Transcript_59135:32-1537(+)
MGPNRAQLSTMTALVLRAVLLATGLVGAASLRRSAESLGSAVSGTASKTGVAGSQVAIEPTLEARAREAKISGTSSIWDSETIKAMADEIVRKTMGRSQASRSAASKKAKPKQSARGAKGAAAAGVAVRRPLSVPGPWGRTELQSRLSAASIAAAASRSSTSAVTAPPTTTATATTTTSDWRIHRHRNGTPVVFTPTWPPGGPKPINASGGENVCKKVQLLAIQKTGTSTLYWHIIPDMTKRYQQIWSMGHVNYWTVVDRGRADCAFTMLRDPVDRFLSEFTMARAWNGFELYGFEWDFHDDDLEWLRAIQKNPNVLEAMHEYLHSPKNPGRNRQTLYLLGFDRVPSCRQINRDSQTLQMCPEKERTYPARQYNWDENPDELLAIAKEHLLSLRAFGITDCYSESMRHIGAAMGWDPDATVEMAHNWHERFSQEDKRGLYLAWQPGFQKEYKWEEGVHTLTHFIDPELEEEIRRVNSLDVELVKFARQLLFERGLTSCRRD